MASTYNGSVANLVDPLANSPLNSPSHAGQHTEINDALQALGTWTTFTPTYQNFTIGNGTQSWAYTQFNKTVVVRGLVTWGSTTSLSGDWVTLLPFSSQTGLFTGSATIRDSGTRLYVASVYAIGTTSFALAHSESGNFGTVNATNPITWTTNDGLSVSIIYEAA
jgi:hypothetical protein